MFVAIGAAATSVVSFVLTIVKLWEARKNSEKAIRVRSGDRELSTDNLSSQDAELIVDRWLRDHSPEVNETEPPTRDRDE